MGEGQLDVLLMLLLVVAVGKLRLVDVVTLLKLNRIQNCEFKQKAKIIVEI